MDRVGDLEVAQDLKFQHHMWRFQRVGWALMLLFVLASLIGLSGRGPLSSAKVGGATSGAELRYERFVRHRADTQLTITIQPDQVTSGQATVSISQRYLDGLEVEGTLPEPESVIVDPTWITYVFEVGEASEPFDVTFDIMPVEIGSRPIELRIGSGEILQAAQLVYP